jgi:hypothetical protein
MIEIRYSPPNDLDVSGTVDELQTIRRRILDMTEAPASKIVLEANSAVDPTPYNSTLTRLSVQLSNGPAKVSVWDEEVCVEGSREALEAFASFFNFEPDATERSHLHYEYYDGNEWIDPGSVPLVIRVKKSNGRLSA